MPKDENNEPSENESIYDEDLFEEEEPTGEDDASSAESEVKDDGEDEPLPGEEEYIIMPSADYAVLEESFEKFEKFKDSFDNRKWSDKKLQRVFLLNLSSTDKTVNSGRFIAKANNNELNWVVNPTIDDKEVGISEIKLPDSKGIAKEEKGLVVLLSAIGQGNYFIIPLYHSGFNLALRNFGDHQLIDLQAQIADSVISLGRSTNTFIFSNYGVAVVRIVMEFIIKQFKTASFDIDNVDKLAQYIRIQDLMPLFTGLASMAYPEGHMITRSCRNSLAFEDGSLVPKCTNTISTKLNPKHMLIVNLDDLSKEQQTQIANRTPRTYSLKDIQEYQKNLSSNAQKVYPIKTDNGQTINITIESPTIHEYIKNGEAWISDMVTMTQKFFTDDMSIEEKNSRVMRRTKVSILNLYAHYVKKIEMTIGDGKVSISQPGRIREALESFVRDESAFRDFKNMINEHIEDSISAIAGIKSYECPSCQEAQTSYKESSPFASFIPIDPIQYFFDLAAYRLNKTTNQDM